MVPDTSRAGAPSAWMSVEVVGKEGCLKLVAIPPSEWQPRQVAVVAGIVARSTPKAACFELVESFASEWQFAQLAAAKSSCGFLSAGAVLCAVWHCSHDWKWFPPAIGNPAGCVTLTACVATRCSAPFAWQRRQLAVSPPGAAPVPLQSEVPFAGTGPTNPLCLAFWSTGPWQAVQSTEVDAPAVWQLLQEIPPGRCTAAAPRAWTSPSATGKKMWLKFVAGSPFGWQLRQLAVSVGTAAICRRACLETTWSTASL